MASEDDLPYTMPLMGTDEELIPGLTTEADTGTDGESSDDNNMIKLPETTSLPQRMASAQLDDLDDTSADIGDFFGAAASDAVTKERNHYKSKYEESLKVIKTLEKRSNKMLRNSPAISSDVMTRLNFLEKENQRLKADNDELKLKLREAEGANAVLSQDTHNKSNKLRGANKKVQREKTVAKTEKEKADSAIHMKNERLKSERAARKERNDALAEAQRQRKINGDLLAELEIERSGRPHLREDGTDQNETTVVIPIEFKIHRADFLKMKLVFEANMMKITDQYESWYAQLKRLEEGKARIVGVDYVADKDTKEKIKIGVNLYDDMTEVRDEDDDGV